jgi:hypothetical protein
MINKFNWACNRCGMTSSRKESVKRHINNPRIHSGMAWIIPYTDYIAGRQNGSYPLSTAHLYRTRNKILQINNPDKRYEEDLFDKIERKVEEKLVDRIAENMVQPPLSSYHQMRYPPAGIANSMRKISPYVTPSLPIENIFGISGYICKSCLVIKPKIVLFTNSINGLTDPSEIYPMPTCHRQGSGKSKEDETYYLDYNKTYGYPKVLQKWIRGYWSKKAKMKIMAFHLPSTICSDSNTTNSIGNSVPSYGIKITMSDEHILKKILFLSCDSSVHLKLAVHEETIEGASPIILEAIKNSEYVIETEDQLNAFLTQTKFSTFAFFHTKHSDRVPSVNGVYLVAIFPHELTINRKFSIEVIENKQTVLS